VKTCFCSAKWQIVVLRNLWLCSLSAGAVGLCLSRVRLTRQAGRCTGAGTGWSSCHQSRSGRHQIWQTCGQWTGTCEL